MKNSINIFSVEKGNMYTKEGDKLVWCNLISANLVFDKDLAHYKLHYVLQTEKGVITLDENKIHIYSKKGVEYARDYKTYLPSNNNIKTIECQDLREQYEVIVFDGVTPIRKKITPLVAHFSYDNMRWNITWDTGYDFYIDCYEDENQCAKWNRCLVREKDGTEHYVEGVFYKLRLNEQQMKAVKKFEKICEELKKADVAFIIGAYGDYAKVIPGHIKDITTSCENPEYNHGSWIEVDEDHIYSCKPLSNIISDAKYSEDCATWLKVED